MARRTLRPHARRVKLVLAGAVMLVVALALLRAPSLLPGRGGSGVGRAPQSSPAAERYEAPAPVVDSPATPEREALSAPVSSMPVAAATLVEGRVLDERNLPVGGAEVLLQELGASVGMLWRSPRVVTTSDATGAFRVQGAPADLVRLAARTPQASGDWSLPLRLELGSSREDVVLVVRVGACLTGTVRDRASGEGLEAELELHAPASGPPLVARSSSDGSFEVCGLRAETSYVIAVRSEGYGSLSGPNVFEVPAAARIEPRHFLLDRRPKGTLRVVDGASGAPIAGAEVAFATRISERLPRTLNALATRAEDAHMRTDEQGLAVVPALPSDRAGPRVSAAGYAPRLVVASDWLRAVEGLLELELWPGHELEVRLDGLLPSAEAIVELHLAPRRPGMPFLIHEPVQRAPAGHGAPALFEGLPADRYVAVPRSGGRAPTWSPILVLDEPGGRTSIRLALTAGATLTGTVLPLPGDRRPLVRVLGPAGLEALAQLAPEGTYLLSGLPAGSFHVWAEEEPLRDVVRAEMPVPPPYAQRLSLEEGSLARVDLEWEGAATALTGIVLIDGRPTPGMLVRANAIYPSASAQASPWSDLRETLSDSDGRFALGDLRGQRLRIAAMHLGPGGERLTLVEQTLVREAFAGPIELRAEVAHLSIQASLESDHSPLRWIAIELQADLEDGGVPTFLGSRSWSIQARGSGRFGPYPLPPGSYVLVARGPDGLRAMPEHLRLAPGQSLELVLLFGDRR